MILHIVINDVKTVEQLPDSWSNQDFVQLLDRFGFPDAAESKPEELKELLAMAVTDFEPEEAAAIVLDYKLSDRLNEGQIEQISHDMLTDKISEEYPEIDLHHQLFMINQLLYKSYNGKFPCAKASIVEFEIKQTSGEKAEISNEIVLKALQKTLNESNVIKRLFPDQLEGKKPFPEADSIIWELKALNDQQYRFITSEYWMGRDEFMEAEFDAEVVRYEESDVEE
ncbi:hypothetical protein DN752_14250 [Echinicola strongylocentroti]|uniref:Uncharacterized protein n=1 Tax=Echinicola strongylocentroti TaxID=1795355 RepID=A0A2Z4IPU6_9BACT|nr:hypothetical protein DN752_14250 [Echinicola strongylocentroti]